MSDENVGGWLTDHAEMAVTTGLSAKQSSSAVYCVTSMGGPGLDKALAADSKLSALLQKSGAHQSGSAAFKKAVAQFAESPLSGIATVTELAFRRSGMKPGDPDADGNEAALKSYSASIRSAPFFTQSSDGDGFDTAQQSSPLWNRVNVLHQAFQLVASSSTTVMASWIYVESDRMNFGTTTVSTGSSGIAVDTSAYAFGVAAWPSLADRVAGAGMYTTDDWSSDLATKGPDG